MKNSFVKGRLISIPRGSSSLPDECDPRPIYSDFWTKELFIGLVLDEFWNDRGQCLVLKILVDKDIKFIQRYNVVSSSHLYANEICIIPDPYDN